MQTSAKTRLGAAIAGGVLMLNGCSAGYLLKQGYGQTSLLFQRESMEAARTDARLSDEQRQRLDVVTGAKAYATRTLGLKQSASYDHVIVLDRNAVTYVVSGAPKDKLEPYLWHFPVVGAVPYKGFFDRSEAIAEQEGLKAKGFDTHLRGVAAFSLLGWIPDPLYSPLLKYEPPVLANTIIHELTHGTVFLKGESSFNEGFATFIGNQGGIGFMRERYGPDSAEARYAEGMVRDERKFTAFLQGLGAELRALYGSSRPLEEKLSAREKVFAEAQAQFALIPFETDHYAWFGKATLNNAFLMTLLTYQSNADRFEQVYDRLGRDLKAMVQFFRDQVAKQPDPEAYLDGWLKG